MWEVGQKFIQSSLNLQLESDSNSSNKANHRDGLDQLRPADLCNTEICSNSHEFKLCLALSAKFARINEMLLGFLIEFHLLWCLPNYECQNLQIVCQKYLSTVRNFPVECSWPHWPGLVILIVRNILIYNAFS